MEALQEQMNKPEVQEQMQQVQALMQDKSFAEKVEKLRVSVPHYVQEGLQRKLCDTCLRANVTGSLHWQWQAYNVVFALPRHKSLSKLWLESDSGSSLQLWGAVQCFACMYAQAAQLALLIMNVNGTGCTIQAACHAQRVSDHACRCHSLSKQGLVTQQP